jgi:hypothetical protein
MNISGSKAKILSLLSRQNLIFKIPLLDYFTYYQWSKDKRKIISLILNKYKKKKLALRSSAIDEDTIKTSNAGKYKSFLNVKCSKKIIEKKITDIFNSYKKFRPIKKNDKFIVQQMLSNLTMSGVLFTKDLETGSDYYVINYDDISGLTDSVTSGKGEFANRSIYIKRNRESHLHSKRFKILIDAVKDLEKKLNNENLDIEFAVSNRYKPYLLQVRELRKFKEFENRFKKKEVSLELKKIAQKIENIQKEKIKTYNGKHVFLGNMPDWNPAEIIGNKPKNLAFSLYNYLIAKKNWVKARNKIGYKNNKYCNLVTCLGGSPYVNIKLSLNSFLPEGLPDKFNNMLIDFWQLKLKSEPHNHDKIEFNIAITCYDFLIKNKVKTRIPSTAKVKDINLFLKNLHNLTNNIILEKNNLASLSNQIDQIKKLNKKFIKIKNKSKKPAELAREIEKNLIICSDSGILPFSIIARYAFISISLLNSLVEAKIINNHQKFIFLKSLDNITTQFLKDGLNLKKGLISSKQYMEKYGHLRPGTYNLDSKKYEKIDLDFFKNQTFKKNNSNFFLDKKTRIAINKILKKNKFNKIDSEKLFLFFSNSIKWREKAKFIYTKYISYILDLVEDYGKIYKISKKDLVFLDIQNIISMERNKKSKFNKRNKLLEIIKKNKKKFEINSMIKLPQLIFDKSAAYIVPYIVSSPNFVTNKNVTAKFLFLKKSHDFNKKIENNLILTENADPGFDWIFQKKIKGLITKYGGANSHMTIRCSELNIPAAIGIGEKKFNELVNKTGRIELDCLTKKIT